MTRNENPQRWSVTKPNDKKTEIESISIEKKFRPFFKIDMRQFIEHMLEV